MATGQKKLLLGFAQSCGVDLKELERFETSDGVWLAHQNYGRRTYLIDDIAEVVDQTLKKFLYRENEMGRWG